MNRLDELENRSIYILCETYSHFEKIAALYPRRKDSTVLLSPPRKAFLRTVLFPVIHIDTCKKCKCIYTFRERRTGVWNPDLIVAKNTSKAAKEASHTDKLSCCNVLKKESLKQAVSKHNFDAIMPAIRRDEHGIRAKERHLS